MLKMKILSGPFLVRDYDRGHEGITAFEIIDFSHISIHTFLKTREIFIDIFSCKPFDIKKIQKYLFEKLNVSPSQVTTFEIKYPWE